MISAANIVQTQDKNQEATVYIGNLDEKVNEALIWELMLQAGPVRHVHILRDRITQTHQGYAFCEFASELDADYAVKVMNQVRLWGKPMKVNRSSADKRTLDIGANLFVGNLAPEVDEKLLYDTFGSFGTIITAPTVARDPNTGISRGFGFVSYDAFESSDAAVEAMNGQYLCNRPISASYAFKKDAQGERHGSAAERLLAAQAKKGSAVADKSPSLQAVQPTPMQIQAQSAATQYYYPPQMSYYSPPAQQQPYYAPMQTQTMPYQMPGQPAMAMLPGYQMSPPAYPQGMQYPSQMGYPPPMTAYPSPPRPPHQ